ncbi:ras-related and estrogen-regulated growth inhibitor-like [Branchiostoma floridae x Branchiostoma belcheri]
MAAGRSPVCGRKTSGPTRTVKVVVLGQAGVGKTAMTVRFVTKRFIGDYDPTLEAIYHHRTFIDDNPVQFEVLDTAGQEENSLALEQKIRWGDAFVIVYSINDLCSFDEVMRIKFLINHTKGPNTPVTLAGNKRDLELDRMVARLDGEKMADTLGCGFSEITTKESYIEVARVFEGLYAKCKEQMSGKDVRCRSPKSSPKLSPRPHIRRVKNLLKSTTGKHLDVPSFGANFC